jgi:hypothetical protein
VNRTEAAVKAMVVGALLHDAVEDEGDWPRLRDIEANYGSQPVRSSLPGSETSGATAL